MKEIVNRNASYDVFAKRLLSSKSILARILKYTAVEFSHCTEDDIAKKYIEGEPYLTVNEFEVDDTLLIKGSRTEENSPREGLITYDIKFDVIAPVDGSIIKMIINIEAQKKYKTGYPLLKRAIYYAARLISSQKERDFRGSDYGRIKKVYTIWVCMDVPKYLANSIQRYNLRKEDVHGSVNVKNSDYDLITIVMLNLGEGKMSNDLLGLLHLLFLDMLSSDEKVNILRDRYAMPLTARMKEDLDKMGSNLMQAAIDVAIRNAALKGEKDGERAERIKSIRSLMETMTWTAQQAMNALKIPASEQSEYLALL